MDRPIEINKLPVGGTTISSPVSGIASPFAPTIKTRSLSWEAVPDVPLVEYDLEELAAEEPSASGPIIAIFVGGTIITGTLGFLVYRGLNQN